MSRKSIDKKSSQLGMPFGTASNRLVKMILFDLVKKSGQDNCYKCGKNITTWNTLSIEHKDSWLDVSTELFWNLDNIAFSHRKCNKADRFSSRKRRTDINKNTGFRGVSYDKSRNLFEARAYIENKKRFIGYFSNAIDAAVAYDNFVVGNLGSDEITNKSLGLL